MPTPPSPTATFRRMHCPHGEADLHAFGGMLAPVVFRASLSAQTLP